MSAELPMQPLRAYDVFREMHTLLKRAVATDFKSYATGEWIDMDRRISAAFEDVSSALYKAEGLMAELEANAKPGEF